MGRESAPGRLDRWSGESGRRLAARIPPIGPGLAVIASVAVIVFACTILLSAYFWSLHMVRADARIRTVDAEIGATRADIQRLRMEYEIRGRMTELERWSGTLGLGPGALGQYARTPRLLAGVAGAREQALASGTLTGFVADPCAPATATVPGACKGASSGGRHGYAPTARDALDGLIGKVADTGATR